MISPSAVQAVTTKSAGQLAALNGQGVVAVDREALGQLGKHAFLRGLYLAGLAMHELLGSDDFAAKGRTYGLVAQAYAQNRQLARKVPNGCHRDASLGR
jgi:hypothetical protein